MQHDRTIYTNPYPVNVIATFVPTDGLDDCLMINDRPVGTQTQITYGNYTWDTYIIPTTGYSFALSASESFSLGVGNLVDDSVAIKGVLSITVV